MQSDIAKECIFIYEVNKLSFYNVTTNLSFLRLESKFINIFKAF